VAEDDVLYFETPADFRAWLAENHDKRTEQWVGFRKKGSGRPSITWPESVDEALCFGWIDGIRKSVDAESYKMRFTPRRKGSIWSAVNVKRAGELIALGRMQPAGLREFEMRDPNKTNMYSFEQKTAAFTSEQEAEFRANSKAWAYWETRPPHYKRAATWWVISAKQEATRQRRLATLIENCATGRTVDPLTRPSDKQAGS
jgi:uncharacterized protein YdeI (YjbR/CyaY-like superfamily)